NGAAIGEAVRKARHTMIERYGEDTIVWAGYMLYGDPSTRYVLPEVTDEMHGEKQADKEAALPAFGEADSSAAAAVKGWRYAAYAITTLALVAGLMFFLAKPGHKGDKPQAAAPAATAEADRKQIDELVASLASRYREGKFEQAAPRDEWSSRPLTLAVMDIRTGSGEGQDKGGEKVVNLLNKSLQSDQAITVVERQILDKLLAELKLGSSALADPATALRLGKLFSARFIVTGTVMPESGGQSAIIRLIDTETSAVGKMVSAQSPGKEAGSELCGDLGRQIGEWAKAEFPLRGRIITVAGQQCKVNLGSAHGLKKGARLEVVTEAKKGSGIYTVTGELEVSEVGKDTSVATIATTGANVAEKEKIRIKL
ncbi:MAG TPA: CsgG/HfaB family protein, partial [Desulfuromonadaceae bacterium]